jgi:hypothetical protein
MGDGSDCHMPDDPPLAERQAQLVAALVSGASLPVGFDSTRARVVADILRAKRRKALQHTAPDLAKALGPHWRELFDRFAATTLVSSHATAFDDAIAFVTWCLRNVPRRWALLRLLLLLHWRRIVSRAQDSRRAPTTEGTPYSSLRDDSETPVM